MDKRSPNDLGSAVPKFCLALEEFRRTSDGRVRTSQELLQHFFPHDAGKVSDRIFKYLPNEVRGPVLTSWGLRGAKSALKDTDDKVQSVVWDALLAGDIDHEAFEHALVADIIVKWVPLPDWWAFWRGGKLSKLAIHKALDTGFETGLFDAKWFFDTVESPGGKLKGTDVVSEGLTKAELTEWVRKVHASGDGSPKGLLAALGWDRIVGKTPNDVLVKVIDAMAEKARLVEPPPKPEAKVEAKPIDRPVEEKTTDAPPGGAEAAEAALMNAVVAVQKTRTSVPPSAEEMIDKLFSESKLPPPEGQVAEPARVEPESEQMIVVEEDIDVGNATNESPTSRPPPPTEEPLLLQKTKPSAPQMPAARRR